MTNSTKGSKGGKGSINTSSNIYDEFEPLIQLFGKSYDPIKRAVFYNLIGSVIKDNKIIFNNKLLDTRINLFIPLKSGYGKGDIKHVIKKTIKSLNMSYYEPTSLHHEQLIGKTRRDNKGNQMIIKGHLSNDFLVFEESTDLFTDDDKKENRNYIKIALDPIGNNEVSKRNVDISKRKGVKYCPECTITFFFHPVRINNMTLKQGLLRRGLIIYVNPTDDERMLALIDSNNSPNTKPNWSKWINFLNGINNKNVSWNFSKNAEKAIVENIVKIVKMGNIKGGNISRYSFMMSFTLKDFLIKMSCIQAAIHNRSTVEESDVDNAFKDLEVFWNLQLEYVINKVKGNFNYEDNDDEDPWVKDCLNILLQNGCTSTKTDNMMIKGFKSDISKQLGVKERMTQTYYSRLKDKGYIDSKQVGKHDSSIWLTDKGNQYIGADETLATLQPLNEKSSIFGKIKEKINRG